MYEQYSDKFESIYQAVPQGKVFRLTYDPIVKMMKLVTREYQHLEEIRESFSVENDQAFFSKQYGYRVDQRKYAINKFGYFAPGLTFEVLDWIKTHYGDLSFIAISKNCIGYINDILQPLKAQLKGHSFEIDNVADETGRNAEILAKNDSKLQLLQFRDYQLEAVKAWLFKGYGRGLIEIPTSGGKSFIIANFIWNIHKHVNQKWKVMIFVPNTQLVEQFYKDLLDYGYRKENLAKFTGSMKAKERRSQDLQNAKIIIANRQYVFANAKSLPDIDVLIADEVHQCNAEASREYILNLMAPVKVGCSGTIPKDRYRYWELLGMFGKVVYKQDIADLQDQGFISQLKITLLDVFHRGVEGNRNYLFHTNSLNKYHPDEFGNSDVLFNDAYNAELEFYRTNSFELYAPVLKYLNTLEENILVLFDRVETGKNIFEQAKELVTSKKAFYIDGATEVSIREEVRQEFERSGNNILIGNVSILGTGINIKRLSHLVFLCNTKSYSRTIQSIGRTLRLHSSKSQAHLVDVVYNFKYSRKHFNERMQFYKDIYKKKKVDEIVKLEI